LKLSLSPRATRDLEAIGDYIGSDNPARAVSFIREIRQQFRRIARLPAAYPARDDLAAGLRMSVHGKYLILFRVVNKTVRVERIIHGARNLRDAGLSTEQ
jgi:toxin ParE1/3/4